MTATHSLGGFRATRTDEDLTVHRVPIFVECERYDVQFDAKWIADAVHSAKQQQMEGYLPPLHIRHHDSPDSDVLAAGYFRIVEAGPITFKGSRRVAIFADLVITNPGVQEDVLRKRLPYRSVEIIDVDKPGIASLALLDHQAPFLELPMLMVGEVEDRTSNSLPAGTALHAWQMQGAVQGDAALACFRRGQHAHLLFDTQETGMAETTTEKEQVTDKQRSLNFEDDPPKDKNKKSDDNDADMEAGEGGLDISAVVTAIESGEISVNDMDAILAAIQAQRADAEPTEEPEAKAPVQAMNADKTGVKKFAAMQAEIDTLKAREKEREELDACKTDVATAMDRLKDRPLGSLQKLEDDLFKFRKDHGEEAFNLYVEAKEEGAPIKPDTPVNFTGNTQSKLAMKFLDFGPDKVAMAAKFEANWQMLKAKRATNIPRDEWVKRAMAEQGVHLEEEG